MSFDKHPFESDLDYEMRTGRQPIPDFSTTDNEPIVSEDRSIAHMCTTETIKILNPFNELPDFITKYIESLLDDIEYRFIVVVMSEDIKVYCNGTLKRTYKV